MLHLRTIQAAVLAAALLAPALANAQAYHVSYNGLDLSKHADAKGFQRRIEDTAMQFCSHHGYMTDLANRTSCMAAINEEVSEKLPIKEREMYAIALNDHTSQAAEKVQVAVASPSVH